VAVDKISTGDEAIVILKQTPFYAESGGQVGDSGLLSNNNAHFEVMDTQKRAKAFIHIGTVSKGEIALGDNLNAEIDADRRDATIRNHSATHLMHAALRELLGEHVQQKGSLVNNERLRFDFSHNEAMSAEQLSEIERVVNLQIRNNVKTEAQEMAIAEAKSKGAMALFGEKYGDQVRVVSMGGFSIELCGGVHVRRSGDIGYFKIISEAGTASGIRRIEALTGVAAIEYSDNQSIKINRISSILKSNANEVEDRLAQLMSRLKSQDREIAQLKLKMATQTGGDLTASAIDVNGLKVLAVKLEGADSKSLRDTMDQLKNKLGSSTKRLKAGDLVNMVAGQIGGKGGGRPDMAMAGGSQPENLDKALASVKGWVEQQLS